MRVASCVVCGERVNVLQEKLVTAQWVDAASGGLVEMQFHSPCFVRWYQESASSRPAPPEAPAPAPAAPPPAPERAGPPAPPPAAAPSPEDDLSPAERERLRELRGRLEHRGGRAARPPGGDGEPGGPGADGPERSDGQDSGRAGDGQQVEGDQQRVHEDDQTPQNE
ncbi:MAG TPA: hypothetical protein VNK05_15585 [Chloroflexota bacterium]|nr:hypothetical protein [Chloroflexota bacterium]